MQIIFYISCFLAKLIMKFAIPRSTNTSARKVISFVYFEVFYPFSLFCHLTLFLSYKLTVFGLMQNFLYLRCKYRFAICIFCFFWGENIIRKVERCIFLWHSTCLLFYTSHWHIKSTIELENFQC